MNNQTAKYDIFLNNDGAANMNGTVHYCVLFVIQYWGCMFCIAGEYAGLQALI